MNRLLIILTICVTALGAPAQVAIRSLNGNATNLTVNGLARTNYSAVTGITETNLQNQAYSNGVAGTLVDYNSNKFLVKINGTNELQVAQGGVTVSGVFTSLQTYDSSGVPTVVTNGFGAGASETVSIDSAVSSDSAIMLIVNANGTQTAGSNICFITFSKPRPNNRKPMVIFGCAGTVATIPRFGYDPLLTTTNGIQVIVGSTQPVSGLSYTNILFVR